MHEHAHGHEDSDSNAPAPSDRRRPAAPARLLPVDHSFLHVAALAQATEHPRLVPLLEQAVERSLAARQPFPHTLLTGGSDTSKRVLARAIAADMVAPLAELDLSAMRSPDQLHERLASLERGAILLASGAEQATHGPLPDLVSAANCGRCVLRNVPGGRYEPFTVILCTRERMRAMLAGRDMFGQRFYLERTVESEAIRLRRVLRRAGATCDDDAVSALADGVVSMRLPTLGAATAVATLLARRGTVHLDRAQVNEDCWKTLMLMADPRWLRSLARRERTKQAAAPSAPAQAASPLQAQAGEPSLPPSHPPRASDGGGLANAA